ncbi:MAG: tetratricopeptide repeat protein [Deltaproteobacteria bacterium]
MIGTLALVASAFLVPGTAPAQEEELTPGINHYNGGNYEASAADFYRVVESGTDQIDRQKAEYFLAQSFYKMGLYQPAFQYFGLIVKQGARHRYYFKAVDGLVRVAEKLHDGAIIPSVLNRAYGADFSRLPEKTLNKVNYLVGMLSYRANKIDEAQEFLSAVPKKSSYFARARYLYGLSLVQKSPQQAVKLFQEVMALPPGSKYFDLDNVRQLTRLALARTYYGMGQYDASVRYYEAVPRFSDYWDQALFENGWAEFQDGHPGKALGSLEALHAPQFEGAFAPESWILKATIYFFSCLYPETKGAIKGFRRIYLPMDEKIKSVLGGDHDYDFYWNLVENPQGELPLAVVNYLLGNQRVLGFKGYLNELAREKRVVDGDALWKETGLAQDLSQLIDTQSQTLVRLTGKFVQDRLKYASKVIEGFDSQAEIILFETLKSEKELIERNVDASAKLRSQQLYRARVPDPNWDYWAFEGEFWIDEIGYYEYTLKNGCALRQEAR